MFPLFSFPVFAASFPPSWGGFLSPSIFPMPVVPARLPALAQLTQRCAHPAPALTTGNHRPHKTGTKDWEILVPMPSIRGEAPANISPHPGHGDAATPATPQEKNPLLPHTPPKGSMLQAFSLLYSIQLSPSSSTHAAPKLPSSDHKHPVMLQQQPPPHGSHPGFYPHGTYTGQE